MRVIAAKPQDGVAHADPQRYQQQLRDAIRAKGRVGLGRGRSQWLRRAGNPRGMRAHLRLEARVASPAQSAGARTPGQVAPVDDRPCRVGCSRAAAVRHDRGDFAQHRLCARRRAVTDSVARSIAVSSAASEDVDAPIRLRQDSSFLPRCRRSGPATGLTLWPRSTRDKSRRRTCSAVTNKSARSPRTNPIALRQIRPLDGTRR